MRWYRLASPPAAWASGCRTRTWAGQCWQRSAEFEARDLFREPDHPVGLRRRHPVGSADPRPHPCRLLRNRIALYWLYLRSVNSPNLETQEPDAEAVPEIALHHFFQSLPTPYRAYQAEEKGDLERAVADVGKQQNFPLDFAEQIPRRDFSWACGLLSAARACALLLVHRVLQLRSWS